jgi:hypothetical protein
LDTKVLEWPLTVKHWESPNTRMINHERTVYENLNCPTFSNLLCEQLTDRLRQFLCKNDCKHDLQTQNWLIGLYRCAKIWQLTLTSDHKILPEAEVIPIKCEEGCSRKPKYDFW